MKQPTLGRSFCRSLRCGLLIGIASLVPAGLLVGEDGTTAGVRSAVLQRIDVFDLIGLTTAKIHGVDDARIAQSDRVRSSPVNWLSLQAPRSDAPQADSTRPIFDVINVQVKQGADSAPLLTDASNKGMSFDARSEDDRDLIGITEEISGARTEQESCASDCLATTDVVDSTGNIGEDTPAGRAAPVGQNQRIDEQPLVGDVATAAVASNDSAVDNSITPLESTEPVSLGPPPAAGPTVQYQAERLIEGGIILARRGAIYTSRARFIRALRLVTQAFDTKRNTRTYSDSLARGLVALDEARDFRPQGSRLEADLSVARIVSTHRTSALHGAKLDQMSPLVAMQRYHQYAEEQLTIAGGRERVAADALFALGRLQNYLSQEDGDQESTGDARAMSLYQVALIVNPDHLLAANELGVLFARYGQWREARAIFRHCVKDRRNFPEVWRNLARVHEQLGEVELARLAYEEFEIAERSNKQPAQGSSSTVAWVDPKTFANLASDANEPPRTTGKSPEPVSVTRRARDSSPPSANARPMTVRQRYRR